jgi:hypothetical protein
VGEPRRNADGGLVWGNTCPRRWTITAKDLPHVEDSDLHPGICSWCGEPVPTDLTPEVTP